MTSEGERVMTLRDYLQVLRRRKWIVIVPIVLAPIVAVVLAHRQPRRYAASAQVTVSQQDLPSSVLDFSQSARLHPHRRRAQRRLRIPRLPSGEDRLNRIVLSFFIEFGPAQRLVRELSELSAGRPSPGGVV